MKITMHRDGPTIVTGPDAAVTIALPSELQSKIYHYAQNDTCAAKRKNKRFCDVGSLGADIISRTGSGDVFNELIMLPTGAQMPALVASVAVGFAQVVAAGQQIAELAASNSLLQAVAEICLWIAYEKLNNAFSATQPLVIPRSDIATSNVATASTPYCPDITAGPNCNDCGGNDGKSLCVGNNNGYTSCFCYDPPKLKYSLDAADWAALPAAFDAMTIPSTTIITSSITPTISTTTALAQPTPVLTCQNYNTYFNPSFCGWRDIQPDIVDSAVGQFWVQFSTPPIMTSTSNNITQFWQGKGDNYIFNIGWIQDCAGPAQYAPNPLAWNKSVSYIDLLKDTFYDCESRPNPHDDDMQSGRFVADDAACSNRPRQQWT
ncbi:hypothetical protein IMSHALPRED_010234 [Imshaugia aleurites]|uniref:Uncharacterized protein n=1 Tax=Imshaugia aleurites TaxID=172621 RepID=A0A8H3G626_9LECA|nr:hypothetical protein IMSHALPRED_010234 [Imshaugia aleurites]